MKIDDIAPPECPRCGSPTKLRRSARGPFFGCSEYPDCRGVVDAATALLQANGEDSPSNQRYYSRGRWMSAKFPGKCRGCGERFDEGTEIYYSNKQVLHCEDCADPDVEPDDAATPTASPSTTVEAIFESPEEKREREAREASLKSAESMPVLTFGDSAESTPAVVAPLPPEVPSERRAQIAACAFELDDHQQAVVDWKKGEALVAAAAGSGKSTVLIERTAELVRDGNLPETILTLVYNRSAADQLKMRLRERLGDDIGPRCNAATFHGWAYAILREWYPNAPYLRRIVGLDDGPSLPRLAGRALKAADLSGDWRTMSAAAGFIREALVDLDADDAVEQVAKLRVAGGDEIIAETLVSFTRAFQRVKEEERCIDFADMLYMVVQEIQAGTPRAKELQQRYAHVQVDEGQDINPARLAIAVHLSAVAKSFVIVGDLRQSIYGFTGARPDLFRGRLDNDSTLLVLPINRRSTAKIVATGNAVAAGRDWNLGGDCAPSPKAAEGEDVQIWKTTDALDEASAIADDISARIDQGLALTDEGGKSNYAILTRTNAAAAGLEATLLGRGISVRVLGATGGVWGTTPGREILGYLRGAGGDAHDDIARIACKSGRRVRRDDITAVISRAKKAKSSILTALSNAKNARYGGPDRQLASLSRELSLLSRMDWDERCDAVLETLIDDVRARAAEVSERVGQAASPDEDREAAYESLIAAAKAAGSVKAIDDQIEAMKNVDKTEPAVEISTCHKAKGLEWTVVYVAGCADGLLPHAKSDDEEEERRLFYVAATRGKSVVVFSIGASNEDGEILPSPFLGSLGFDADKCQQDTHKLSLEALLLAKARAADAARAREEVEAQHGAEQEELSEEEEVSDEE